jgi:hypothetical protein
MGWALAIVTIGVILRFGQSAEVIAWTNYRTPRIFR